MIGPTIKGRIKQGRHAMTNRNHPSPKVNAIAPPPPPTLLTAALLALLAGLTAFTQTAEAQTTCTRATCAMTLKSVSPVVDGCGDHARPGRMALTLSSTDGQTRIRNDFPGVVFAEIGHEHRASGPFQDWEWRNENTNRGAWQRVVPQRWGMAAPNIGETIYEVRPVAGARIWSNRTANNPIQGPGELVVVTLRLTSVANATSSGSAYFLFMGGKGCARVGPGGGLLGGDQ